MASLTLFARDVMRLCREEREAPRSEFSLLFHYDSQRRLHVDVLLPKELNEEERRRMDELQRAVALQPPGLFSRQACFRGIQLETTVGKEKVQGLCAGFHR